MTFQNLPTLNSTGHRALSTAVGTFFDAIEMLAPEGAVRVFPEPLVLEVVPVLVGDRGQHAAALIVNDALVHISPT